MLERVDTCVDACVDAAVGTVGTIDVGVSVSAVMSSSPPIEAVITIGRVTVASTGTAGNANGGSSAGEGGASEGAGGGRTGKGGSDDVGWG